MTAAVSVEQLRRRLPWAIAAANVVGAVVLFAFGTFALPLPKGVHHATLALLLSASAFVVLGPLAVGIGWAWSARLGNERIRWLEAGRDPTERERELTLRLPLSLQGPPAVLWGIATVVFVALNAPFSAEVATDVAFTIPLGGLVTCALGYLVAERLLRPITAAALASGVPSRPQLPGVEARALLAWTLGTGVVLVGLVLVGIGGLHESRFTAQRLSILIIVLSVVGILVGLATMVALARSLADPIVALRRALGRVERGDYDHEVAVDDGSEVGLLQAGFNRMIAGLRERERIRDLFGRQVGEAVASEALERGVQLGGESREATVLFVDLEGSTRLAETRDPGEVVSLLNSFFEIVVEVVSAYQGFVNKFEGDAALCIFGAPRPDRDAASHALGAARALRYRLAGELHGIGAGIGVSAGRVVAGTIGTAERFEYTVIGDPVNEAARLTDLAKTRREPVLASEAALSRADSEEAERWELRDAVTLRGRSAGTRVAIPRS